MRADDGTFVGVQVKELPGRTKFYHGDVAITVDDDLSKLTVARGRAVYAFTRDDAVSLLGCMGAATSVFCDKETFALHPATPSNDN